MPPKVHDRHTWIRAQWAIAKRNYIAFLQRRGYTAEWAANRWLEYTRSRPYASRGPPPRELQGAEIPEEYWREPDLGPDFDSSPPTPEATPAKKQRTGTEQEATAEAERIQEEFDFDAEPVKVPGEKQRAARKRLNDGTEAPSDPNQAGPSNRASNTADPEYSPSQTRQGTVYGRKKSMADHAGGSAGDTSMDGGDGGADMSAGTRDAAGQAAPAGVQGAGNNYFWHGIGQNTGGYEHTVETRKLTFKKSFATNCNFNSVTPVAEILFEPTIPHPGASTNGAALYTFNHGGYMVPYYFTQCSMWPDDWNMPPEFLSYKPLSIGFTVKSMRLDVHNNPKPTANDVPGPSPPDVRMWTFVDISGEYGQPEYYFDYSKVSHSTLFTDQDCRISHTSNTLPLMPTRHMIRPLNEALHMLQPGWKQDTTNNSKWTNPDPNRLFNMKKFQGKGYEECRMNEAELSFEYDIKAPKIRFPHDLQTNTTGTMIQPESGWYSHMQNQPYNRLAQGGGAQMPGLTQWLTHNETYGDPADAVEARYMATYRNAQTHPQEDLLLLNPLTATNQRNIDFIRSGSQRTVEGTQTQYGGMIKRTFRPAQADTNVNNYAVDDAGKTRAAGIGSRPPMFYFGLYPEHEILSTGPQPWRYYSQQIIEYYSIIEVHIHHGLIKPFLPIGIGGLYTHWTEVTLDDMRDYPTKAMMNRHKLNRTGHHPMSDTVAGSLCGYGGNVPMI